MMYDFRGKLLFWLCVLNSCAIIFILVGIPLGILNFDKINITYDRAYTEGQAAGFQEAVSKFNAGELTSSSFENTWVRENAEPIEAKLAQELIKGIDTANVTIEFDKNGTSGKISFYYKK